MTVQPQEEEAAPYEPKLKCPLVDCKTCAGNYNPRGLLTHLHTRHAAEELAKYITKQVARQHNMYIML